jgi:AcrR family transcriptional regulator
VSPRPGKRLAATGSARDRLVEAAFAQFAAHGFEATTVDEIAEQAGVSRRTFFRHFATKEDVVFPDHDAIRTLVAADLERRRTEPPLPAVWGAVSLVLADYVRNRDVSLARFQLTRNIVALRDREITNVHRYQLLFTRYLAERLPTTERFQAELMAAAVVTAHNSVLRDWLVAGAVDDPTSKLDAAFASLQQLFGRPVNGSAGESGIVVFKLSTPIAEVTRAIEAMSVNSPVEQRTTRRRAQ